MESASLSAMGNSLLIIISMGVEYLALHRRNHVCDTIHRHLYKNITYIRVSVIRPFSIYINPKNTQSCVKKIFYLSV